MKYIENKINVLRIKQNKTQEDENLLREYLRQEKEINDYFQYFFEHHEMRSFLEASLPNLKDPHHVWMILTSTNLITCLEYYFLIDDI